jgi:hypothetical protein
MNAHQATQRIDRLRNRSDAVFLEDNGSVPVLTTTPKWTRGLNDGDLDKFSDFNMIRKKSRRLLVRFHRATSPLTLV